MGRWIFGGRQNGLRQYIHSSAKFRKLGVPPPYATPTLAMATGGSLDVCATYTYWFCNENDEGDISLPVSASITLSGANNKVVATGWSYDREDISYRRVYRTTGGGAAGYYLTKNAATTASWSDTFADSALGSEEYPTDNDQPAASGVDDFIVYKDRLVVQDGSRLRVGGPSPLDEHAGEFAGRYQPAYQPGRALYLGRDFGAQKDGRGMFVLKGRLYALQSDSLWLVRAESDDPDLWGAQCVSPNVGCESQWTVWSDGDYAYWLGRRAGRVTVFQFDGANLVPIGREVEGTLSACTNLSASVGGGVDGYYRLSLGGMSTELEYQTDTGFGRGAWSVKDRVYSAYATGVVSAYGGDVSGWVYALNRTFNDCGGSQAYEVIYPAARGPDDGPRLDEYPKLWRFMQLELHPVCAIAETSGLSAWYQVDGGSWATLSAAGFPLSAAANTPVLKRLRLPNEAQGREIKIKLGIAGKNVRVKFRGLVVKGHVDMRESI
jgi:hypothetical protein